MPRRSSTTPKDDERETVTAYITEHPEDAEDTGKIAQRTHIKKAVVEKILGVDSGKATDKLTPEQRGVASGEGSVVIEVGKKIGREVVDEYKLTLLIGEHMVQRYRSTAAIRSMSVEEYADAAIHFYENWREIAETQMIENARLKTQIEELVAILEDQPTQMRNEMFSTLASIAFGRSVDVEVSIPQIQTWMFGYERTVMARIGQPLDAPDDQDGADTDERTPGSTQGERGGHDPSDGAGNGEVAGRDRGAVAPVAGGVPRIRLFGPEPGENRPDADGGE